jgi:3-methyladenine DNA glycosylase AlkD
MTMTPGAVAAPSAITVASQLFVEQHMATAVALGEHLADLIEAPGAFMADINKGLAQLADPNAADGIRVIAPGIGPVLGVRLPLLEATHKQFRKGMKGAPTPAVLEIADRLLLAEAAEIRWFGMMTLERLVASDSDRTWQLMSRAAHEATDWISVDTLAHSFATGLLLEPRRWSDLQMLVHSSSRWERRLVGATVATLPHIKRVGAKDTGVAGRGLMLIGQLMGDTEPEVQKALSWAIRSVAPIDPAGVVAFATREAETARKTNDGGRAWVIKDALPKLPAAAQVSLRAALAGIRRRPSAPSQSNAARRPADSSREE